jgi:hypothetical protein
MKRKRKEPKPLQLWRAETEESRLWLVLARAKPTQSQLAEMTGCGDGEKFQVSPADLHDAGHLTPDADEVQALLTIAHGRTP